MSEPTPARRSARVPVPRKSPSTYINVNSGAKRKARDEEAELAQLLTSVKSKLATMDVSVRATRTLRARPPLIDA